MPIFKDEKTKDAVTYCSYQWDVTIFCHLGWDNQHLLPHVLWSLQEFLRDLARSLGEDPILNDVLKMLEKYYGMVMTFDALSKELYCLKQGSGKNIATFGVCLSQEVQILQLEYPGMIQKEHIEEMKPDHLYEGLNPKYHKCWPIMLMVSTLPDTPTCS